MVPRWPKCLLGLIFILSCSAYAKTVLKPRADLNISFMVSEERDAHIYRAMKGYAEVYPFIVIEKIEIPAEESGKPRLVQSWTYKDIQGGQLLREITDSTDFVEMKWKNGDLIFSIIGGGRAARQCEVKGVAANRPKLACT